MLGLPVGYVTPPSIKMRLKQYARPKFLVPISLAAGNLLSLGTLAVIDSLVCYALPTVLALPILVPAFVVQARALRGLENLTHDASHWNWSRRKRLNDFLANLLAAWATFSTVGRYRVAHMRHHHEFGTEHDPDMRRYRQLDIAGLRRGRATAYIGGVVVRLGTYMAGWWQAIGTDPYALLSGCLWHTTFLLGLSIFVPPSALLIGWVLGFGIPFFVVLPPLRFIAEAGKHDYEGTDSVFDATISNLGWVHRWVLHPHGDGYHLLHHLHPCVPVYRLSSLHRDLMAENDSYATSATYRIHILED